MECDPWNNDKRLTTGQVIVQIYLWIFSGTTVVERGRNMSQGQGLTPYNPIRGERFINRDNNSKCPVFAAQQVKLSFAT